MAQIGDTRLTSYFPVDLIESLCVLESEIGERLYVTGGTVRDMFLNRVPQDIDITVKKGAEYCCRRLIALLGGGAYVQLGTEEEEAARVVHNGQIIDFSSFRKGAVSIEKELAFRDVTINAMALSLDDSVAGRLTAVIDPQNGLTDCEKSVLRHCQNAFSDDPLRMLRCFRFSAELGFTIHSQTIAEIKEKAHQLNRIASERIHYEMNRIMDSERAAAVIDDMAECAILWEIFPELEQGRGLEQPCFHHKDVFGHSLLALDCVERIIQSPDQYFGSDGPVIEKYLAETGNKRLLRWASLFHDVGKPSTSHEKEGQRTTFYCHDKAGKEIVLVIADRLKWSNEESSRVGRLVEMHMHPFHLCTVRNERELSSRSILKIYKKAGSDLPGLFSLAMADSLASKGDCKPPGMEEQLSELFREINQTVDNHIVPVVEGEKLLTGTDIIEIFGLEPGPILGKILQHVELARIEGIITDRNQAVEFVEKYLNSREEPC